MRCPYCRHPDSRVVDSREVDEGQVIRRRRSCQDCGKRFTTVEEATLAVIKRTVPADVTLHVQSQGISVAAAQEVIVPQSAGSVAEIPRLPRLGIRTPGH